METKAGALLGLFLLANGNPVVALDPPRFHGISLGETSLADVLVQLGPSSLVGLLHDGEGGSISKTGPIFLRYSETVCFASSCFPSEMTILFESSTYITEGITVEFPTSRGDQELPMAEVVKEVFGAGYQRVKHKVVFDPGDLEGELSSCDHPEGTVVSWIYRDRGLQVVWLGDQEDHQPQLRFHRAIWDGSEAFPPCAQH